MKNQTKCLHFEGTSESRAKDAIENVYLWIQKRYPGLSSLTQSRLIAECLIEIEEEHKQHERRKIRQRQSIAHRA
jgi:hypothetical protein